VAGRVATVAALTAVALIGTGVGHAAAATGSTPPKTTHGPCRYTETPDESAARPVPLPRDPHRTPHAGTVELVLKTSQGDIELRLDRAKAPCTVQSFLHLVRHGFYDHTPCHRLTAHPRLKVLQCGDPTGTGEGGPGYRYKDELPTDLQPAPSDPTGVRRIYPRGVLAMANAGPDTNGSQFFLVYADSTLRPDYTVFGSVDGGGVDGEGLATLDRIAAGGVKPTPDDPAPVDGQPALPVDINRVDIDC
jgi:peptidyl-prolyl cis-trans isomerase B (cyclophilin B)